MVALSEAARENVRALAENYRHKRYVEAVRYLRSSVAQAQARIKANPHGGATFPRPYPDTRIPGVLWIFAHRYWIAYRPAYMTITGVFYDENDIPNHVGNL